jgi:hypothetical protein
LPWASHTKDRYGFLIYLGWRKPLNILRSSMLLIGRKWFIIGDHQQWESKWFSWEYKPYSTRGKPKSLSNCNKCRLNYHKLFLSNQKPNSTWSLLSSQSPMLSDCYVHFHHVFPIFKKPKRTVDAVMLTTFVCLRTHMRFQSLHCASPHFR